MQTDAAYPRPREIAALAAWLAVIVAAIFFGNRLNDAGVGIGLAAPPLVGHWNPRVTPWAVGALFLAPAIAIYGPRLAASLGWRPMLASAAAAAGAWAVALSSVRGPSEIVNPPQRSNEYLGQVDRVGDPFNFLSDFTTKIATYSVHVRGHPPGMVLLLAGMDRIGLSGVGPAAALMIIVGALAVPAALVAMRDVAGEPTARAAAPFLVLAPAAVWVATSADAFFMGVGAWSVTLLVLASSRRGARSDLMALGGGLLFGACLMLSYGLFLLAAVPAVVLLARRSWRVALLGAAGTLAVIGAFSGAGFWWIDGLHATREQYFAGIASDRPFGYFLLSNLAAFGLAIGPVTIVALTRLGDPKAWLLVGGGVASVVLAELSGMSKGEVERIWLPFAPWVLLAACAFGLRFRPAPALLGIQAAVGLAIVVTVHTFW